jgi:NAD(P)-dependent dehydrogenase (short-subunit alcohol dehydrogenase family)
MLLAELLLPGRSLLRRDDGKARHDEERGGERTNGFMLGAGLLSLPLGAWPIILPLSILIALGAGLWLADSCPSEELTSGGFGAIVGIVLQGSFHATLACGRAMIARGTKGSILSILATYTETGSAYVMPSAAAKAGVLAMTRSLAVEWARYGIRANAIAPGPFPTEGAWSRLAPPGFDVSARTQRIPARRFGEHHELANLATYLLARESAYVTGACVTIDGAESLMGGEFNELTLLDPKSLGEVLRAMKPDKR